MNRIIVEIGLLAFCVAAVVFGVQGMDLMETVARSFMVFMIVVCSIAMVMLVASMLRAKTPEVQSSPATSSAPPKQEPSEESPAAETTA
jgi:hypothetical protein